MSSLASTIETDAVMYTPQIGAAVTAALVEMYAFQGADLKGGALAGVGVLAGNWITGMVAAQLPQLGNSGIIGVLGSVVAPALVLHYGLGKPFAEGAVVGLAALGGATIANLGLVDSASDRVAKKSYLAGSYAPTSGYYGNV